MTDKYKPGDVAMWNSTRLGWVEVEIVRKSRTSPPAYPHWIVKVDGDRGQQRIAEYRMMTIPEWEFTQNLKGV